MQFGCGDYVRAEAAVTGGSTRLMVCSFPGPPRSCLPLAAGDVSRLAQATAQRLGLYTEDSVEIIVWRGDRPAITCSKRASVAGPDREG